jgi:PAS domain S-box-containing protein
MILVKSILIASLLIQATGALLAFRLIRTTKHYHALILLGLAAALMALRRAVSLYALWTGGEFEPVTITEELLALLISSLILIGIIYIRPILKNLYSALNNLENTNMQLSKEIGHRKSAEEEAQRKEEQFRKLTESSPLLIWMSDKEGMCIYFNKQWLNFRGRTMEQEKGTGWTEGVHPDDKKNTLEIYHGAFNKRESFEIEYRMLNRNNEYRWIYDKGAPMYNNNGKFLGYIGSCIDISKRKKAEKQLEESEAKFRKLFSESNAINLIIDSENGQIKAANDSARKFYGYENLESMSIHEINQLPVEEVQREMQYAYQKNKNLFYFRHRLANGEIRNVEVHSTPLEIDGTKSLFSIIHDITERLRAEEALRQSEEKFKKSRNQLRKLSVHQQEMLEKERSYIARQIHDELGQNLTAIHMGLAIMRKHITRKDRQLFSKVQELSHITQATLSRIKKLSTELRPQLIDDMGLIAAIEWHSGNFEKSTNITCKTELIIEETDIPKEMAIHIFRILQEGLTNVYKHAEADSVNITLKKADNSIHLIIKDDGKGIREEDFQKTSSFGIQGIEERARLMNGTLTLCENNPGTMVHVEIPLEGSNI